MDFSYNKGLAPIAIEKTKILGAVLELPARQQCQSSPFARSWGWSKKLFFLKRKQSIWPTQKNEFFKTANSQYFFSKISWIGFWVSKIDWCKRHWCGSTYMTVRLSDISSKTGKKCSFCVFRQFLSLCWTASQPYRFSHINALCINQSY